MELSLRNGKNVENNKKMTSVKSLLTNVKKDVSFFSLIFRTRYYSCDIVKDCYPCLIVCVPNVSKNVLSRR